MKIKFIAPYPGAVSSGIFGADGNEVPIGTVIDVEKEPTDLRGRYEVVEGDTAGKAAVTNPTDGGPLNKAAVTTDGENPKPGAETAPQSLTDDGSSGTAPSVPVYEARDKGEGWWAIYDAAGNQVGKSLRKDDAAAFNSLSAEDKAEFVKQDA